MGWIRGLDWVVLDWVGLGWVGLGEEFVGVQPLEVQRLLSEELILFLQQVESDAPMGVSRHLRSGSIRWHRLNRQDADRLVRENQ